AVFRKGKVREREKQLVKRFGVAKWRDDPEGDDPDAYRLAMQAIQAEKDGQLPLAFDLWNKVRARFPDEAKLPFALDDAKLAKARWGWIADDRIRTIEAARAKGQELDQHIAADRNNEKAIPYDPTSPESLAVRAIRLTTFRDVEKAA